MRTANGSCVLGFAITIAAASLPAQRVTPVVVRDVTDIQRLVLTAEGPGVHLAMIDRVITGGGGSSADVRVTSSLDGGATWTDAVKLDGPGLTLRASIDSLASCDSSVYAAWEEEDTVTLTSSIRFDRSTDRGASWDGLRFALDASAASGARPIIAASSSTIVVCWNDAGGVFERHSLDGGNTWSSRQRISDAGSDVAQPTRVVCDGSSIYVAWVDERPAAPKRVFFNSSSDSGTTWRANDVQLTTTEVSAELVGFGDYSLRLAAAGASIHIAWSDESAGTSNVYTRSSVDGGSNWTATSSPVTATGSVVATSPSIATSGSDVYVTWVDDRSQPSTGATDIRFNRSTDSGSSWGTDLVANSTPASIGGHVTPTVAFLGDSVFVGWFAATGQIRCNRSFDSGATWQATSTDLASAGPVLRWIPTFGATGSSFHAFWTEFQPSGSAAFANSFGGTSIPGGCGTWAAADASTPPSETGFTLTAASPPPACSGIPVIMFGSSAASPIALPPPIGCGACSLMLSSVFGSIPSPMVVASGLAPGVEFGVQCGCIALPPGGPACVDLSDLLAIVVGP